MFGATMAGLLVACAPQSPDFSQEDSQACKALTSFMEPRQGATDAETAALHLTEIGDSAAILAREDISPALKDAFLNYKEAISEVLYEYEYEGGATPETQTQLALITQEVIDICSDAIIEDSLN